MSNPNSAHGRKMRRRRNRRTALPPIPTVRTFTDWDAIRPTSDCPFCHGTGIAPGDGRTKCGFCDHLLDKS